MMEVDRCFGVLLLPILALPCVTAGRIIVKPIRQIGAALVSCWVAVVLCTCVCVEEIEKMTHTPWEVMQDGGVFLTPAEQERSSA